MAKKQIGLRNDGYARAADTLCTVGLVLNLLYLVVIFAWTVVQGPVSPPTGPVNPMNPGFPSFHQTP